jgi:hypothetical protein
MNAFQRHYKIGELAEKWNLGRECLRKLFMNEPDVVRISMGKRKKHTTYSIPASTAERVYRRLSTNKGG